MLEKPQMYKLIINIYPNFFKPNQIDLQNTQNVLRITVVVISSRWRIMSPKYPKIKAHTNRAVDGKLDKTPEFRKLNPNASDKNFGPTVNMKYKPHEFPT